MTKPAKETALPSAYFSIWLPKPSPTAQEQTPEAKSICHASQPDKDFRLSSSLCGERVGYHGGNHHSFANIEICYAETITCPTCQELLPEQVRAKGTHEQAVERLRAIAAALNDGLPIDISALAAKQVRCGVDLASQLRGRMEDR